jgi:hypothetical protein
MRKFIVQAVILSSILAVPEILFLLISPAVSAPYYSNCAQLQKRISDNNPGEDYRGFEKIKMSTIEQIYYPYEVMKFCNGGIMITKEEGKSKVCSAYIAYSFSRVTGKFDHYARWGRINGLPNFDVNDESHYCHREK